MSIISDGVNWKLELKAFRSIDLVSQKKKLYLNSMTSHYLTTTSIIQASFYSASLAFIYQRDHLLISLLCLEGIILTLVLYVPLILYIRTIIVPTLRIIILTFGACEARLGLSLIVYISRSYGSDIIKLITVNKC